MRLYNTLTRNVDELKPLATGKVKLYTCGLTVYSQPHIGNWLGYIYWDVLVRTLRAEGFEVVRTQNITDVGHLTSDDDNGEDKMEKGARREGLTAWDVAQKYIDIAAHESDMLGLTSPDHLVRATDTIEAQIAFAKILDDKGFLYRIKDDGMYFDTSKLLEYGRLARLDIDGLEAGARVPVEGKHNITDFAVWKFSHDGQNRDMEWESPWGVGFPGWHLECSVIARETLGNQIDIHTGGIDHIPVHHINEIAQTEAVTGKPFSQFWVHNNHLKADGQKMAKSVGNIYTLQDILDRGYGMDAFRLFALGKHYRTEGNFTWENLEAAQNRLNNWQEAADLFHQIDGLRENCKDEDGAFKNRLVTILADDLDTVGALQLIDQMFDAVKESQVSDECFGHIQNVIADVLGIDLRKLDISDDLKSIIGAREAARADKDWAR
ncbi:MAG: cysteine--tRNA ligase, partial [Candidatus Saccharimonadales bacterium]